MISRNPRPGRRNAFLAALGLVFLAANTAPAQSNPPERAVRQIKVMEGILEQVLTDSPNFMVFGHENVHGVYLAEFGAVFTFEASLTDQSEGLSALRNLKFDFPSFKINTGKDGKETVIEIPQAQSNDSTSSGEDSLSTPPDPPTTPDRPGARIKEKSGLVRQRRDMERARRDLARARAEMRGRSSGGEESDNEKEADSALLYKKGKAELVQALLDYGDTITSLRDDQWIALAAFLKDSGYFLDNRISRLVLKAKARDLRDYAAGKIPESDMRRRIMEEEY